MKLSQDLIIGFAIGAAAAYVLTKANAPEAPVQPRNIPTLPTRKNLPGTPPVLVRNYGIVGMAMHPDWYRRRGIPGY